MSIGEKELVDEALSMLRGSAGTRKTGDIFAVATFEKVLLRGMGLNEKTENN